MKDIGELPNHKQAIAYDKIIAMCKLIDGIKHLNLNRYGSLIFNIMF
jgi:hypothetical protein